MSDSLTVDASLDNLTLEEWRKRYLELAAAQGAPVNFDEPSMGTKIASAFGEFRRTTSENAPMWIAELLGAPGTGQFEGQSGGDWIRRRAATQLIPDFEELSKEEQSSQLNEILTSKNAPDPLLDWASDLYKESRQHAKNIVDPTHKDYMPDYHAYTNWQRSVSITEDGMFDPDVMTKAILQGLPSLATSMTAGFIGGIVGGPGGAIGAGFASTFMLEGSSEFKEAVDYYMGEGYNYKEASHLAQRSAAAYGLGAALLETLPSGRIFKGMFGATDDIARATNKGLFNRVLSKTSARLGQGVDDYNDYVANGLGKFIDRTVVQGAVEALEEGSQYMLQTAIQSGYRDETYGELFDWDEFLESAWGGALLGIGSGTTGSLVGETQVIKKLKDRMATPESGGLQVKQQEDGTYAVILYGPEPVKEGEEVDESAKPKMVEKWRSEPFDTYKEANEDRDRVLGLFRKAKAEGREGAFLDKPVIDTSGRVESVKKIQAKFKDNPPKVEMPPRSDDAIILLDAMGNETSLTPRESARLKELKTEGISGEQVEKSLTPNTLNEANVSPEEAMRIAEEMALNVPDDISAMVEPDTDVISPLDTPQGDPSDIPTITGDPSIGPTGPVIEPEGPAIEPTGPVIEPEGPAIEPTGPANKNVSAKGKMTFAYGSNKRTDVKSTTTFEAIKNNERTATTRYESDGHIDYWKNLKIGDIIEWESATGEKIKVEITKPLHKLVGSNKTAEQWSKLEGWSVDYFNSKVKPKLNEAWQIEYKPIQSPDAYRSTQPTQQSSEVEAKKVDIERRRGISLRSVSQTSLNFDAGRGYVGKYNIKGTEIIDSNGKPSTIFRQTETIREETKEEVEQELNAKYDAELAALEEAPQDIEAKKADIEKRRQEELADNDIIIEDRGDGNYSLVKTKGSVISIEERDSLIGKRVDFIVKNPNNNKFINSYKGVIIKHKSTGITGDLTIELELDNGQIFHIDRIGDFYTLAHVRFTEEIPNIVIEINAKYDAELKALEEQPTEQSSDVDIAPVGPEPEPTGPPGSEQIDMFGPEEFPDMSPEKAEEMRLAKTQDMVDEFSALVESGGDIAPFLSFKNIETLELLSNKTTDTAVKSQIDAVIADKKSRLPKRQSKGFKGGPQVPSRRTVGLLREKLGLPAEEPLPSIDTTISITKIADALRAKTGIKTEFINDLNKKDAFGNPIKAFVEERDGSMVPVVNLFYAAESDVFHEYVHIILAAMRDQNMPGFDSLWDSIKKEAWFSELAGDVRRRYDYELSDSNVDNFKEEVMAHAIGWLANDKYKQILSKENHKTFKEKMLEFIKVLAEAINSFLGAKVFNTTHDTFESVDVNKIVNMSLGDFVDLMADTNRDIDLGEAWHSTGLKLADITVGHSAQISHPAFYEDNIYDGQGKVDGIAGRLETMYLAGMDLPSALDLLFFPFEKKLKIPKRKYRPRKEKDVLEDVSKVIKSINTFHSNVKRKKRQDDQLSSVGEKLIPPGFVKLLELYHKAQFMYPDNLNDVAELRDHLVSLGLDNLAENLNPDNPFASADKTGKIRTDVMLKSIGQWIDTRVLLTKKAEELITSFNSIDHLLSVNKKDPNAIIDISKDFGTEDNPAYLVKKVSKKGEISWRLVIGEIELEMINKFREDLFTGALQADDYLENKSLVNAAKGTDIIKLSLLLELYAQHAKMNYGIRAQVTEGNEQSHRIFYERLGFFGIEDMNIATTNLYDNHIPFQRGAFGAMHHDFAFLKDGIDGIRLSGNGFIWYVMGMLNNEAVITELQSDQLPEFHKKLQALSGDIKPLTNPQLIEQHINGIAEELLSSYISSKIKYAFPIYLDIHLIEQFARGTEDMDDSNFMGPLSEDTANYYSDLIKSVAKAKRAISEESFFSGLIYDVLLKKREKGSLWAKEYNQLNKDLLSEMTAYFDHNPKIPLARGFFFVLNKLKDENRLPYWISKYDLSPFSNAVLVDRALKGIPNEDGDEIIIEPTRWYNTPSGVDYQSAILKLFPSLNHESIRGAVDTKVRYGMTPNEIADYVFEGDAMLKAIDKAPKTFIWSDYSQGWASPKAILNGIRSSKYMHSKKIQAGERFINTYNAIIPILKDDAAFKRFKREFLNWNATNVERYTEYLDNVYKPALREHILQEKSRLKDPENWTGSTLTLESKIFDRLYTSGSAQRIAILHAMKVAHMKGYDKIYLTGGIASRIAQGNDMASGLYYTEGEANTVLLSNWLSRKDKDSSMNRRELFQRIADSGLMGKMPIYMESLLPVGKKETQAFEYIMAAIHTKRYDIIKEIVKDLSIAEWANKQRKSPSEKARRIAPQPISTVSIQARKTAGKKNFKIVSSNDMTHSPEPKKIPNPIDNNVFRNMLAEVAMADEKLGGLIYQDYVKIYDILTKAYKDLGVEYYELTITDDNAGKPFKRLSKMDKPLDDDSQDFTIEPGSRAYDQIYNKIDSAYKRSVGKIRRMGQTIEHNKIVAAIGEMIPSQYKNVFDDWLIKKMNELGDNFDRVSHRPIDNSQNILSTQEANEILRSSESEFMDDMNGDGDIDVATMTKSLYKIERKAFRALGVVLTPDEEAKLLSRAQEIKDFDTWIKLVVSEITGKDPEVMKTGELLAYQRLHLSVNNQVRVNHPDSLMNEKSNIIIELHGEDTLVYGKGEKNRMFLDKAIDDQYNSNPSNPKRERTTLVYHKYLSGEYKSRLVFLNGSDILGVIVKKGQQKLRESYDVLTDNQLKSMLWDKFLPLDIVPMSTRGEEGGLIFARITQEHKDHASTPTSLKDFWNKQIADGYITEKDAAEMINTIFPMRAGNIARFLAMNEVIPGFMVVKETNEAGQEVIKSADAANIFNRIKIPFTPAITNGDMQATNMVLVDKEDIMFSFPDSSSKLGGIVSISGLGKKYRADGATLTSRSAFNKMRALGLKPGANKAKTVMYQKDGDNVIAVKHEHFALEPGMKIWKKSGALIGEVDSKGDILDKNGDLIDFISTNDEVKIYKGYEENMKNQSPVTFIGKSIGLIKYADRERPNATHPHQWYNYVRDKNIQKLVADHYINDENSPVKRILREVFQIANSAKSIEEFANKLDRNTPDVASLILIEKARAGAGLHPDIALFFDNLVQARFASKAMSLEIGVGTYLDIMPNFRGDLKENEIALNMDDATPVITDWANATNNDVKDATIAKVNEWLQTRDYRVLTSRFPIPHIGGVSYARVKRLHAFKGVVEASPVMVFKRKEGDHDGDAMQVEFIPEGEMHETLRDYIDSVHTKTEAINLDRFTDKSSFSYASISDVYKLKASIARGGKAIQSIAAIQNVYGILQDVFQNVDIKGPDGGTWTLIPGDRVVDLDFMEEGYSDTVNQKLRILLQAAVDNAKYMLLSKWNFDRNDLLLSLFETVDARGETFNLADLEEGTPARIQASVAINAIYKEIRRVGFIRNGGDFQSKSWGFSDLIKNSEIYDSFVSDRESYMSNVFSKKGIEASVSFNDSLSVLEQMAITPFQMYQRYKKNHQLNSPYIYDDIIYENIHQDVLSEWDTEAKRVELIATAVETDIGLGNYSNKQDGDRHAEAGVSYAKRMGKAYYSLMDTLKGKIYPTTWDHNQEVREFMLEFDEEFKSLTEVGKYMATLEFLRGVKKLDGTRVYNVKFMPPYSHSPSLPSLLSLDVMQEYNKLYNDHLLEKDGRTRDPEKRRDMINRATNSEIARRICIG